MLEIIFSSTNDNMKKAVEHFSQSLTKLRTGRASAALLDGINVDYYGASTPLKNMANISTPEARLIVIQPWDMTALPAIEKAILKSDLGLHPTIDGKVMRIGIPVLTEERRKDLAKVVSKMGEECKVNLRQHRREGNEELKAAESAKEMTEDENHRGQEKIQKALDEFVTKVDQMVQKKQTEIMEV
jgi:ribosome recycling factor